MLAIFKRTKFIIHWMHIFRPRYNSATTIYPLLCHFIISIHVNFVWIRDFNAPEKGIASSWNLLLTQRRRSWKYVTCCFQDYCCTPTWKEALLLCRDGEQEVRSSWDGLEGQPISPCRRRLQAGMGAEPEAQGLRSSLGFSGGQRTGPPPRDIHRIRKRPLRHIWIALCKCIAL